MSLLNKDLLCTITNSDPLQAVLRPTIVPYLTLGGLAKDIPVFCNSEAVSQAQSHRLSPITAKCNQNYYHCLNPPFSTTCDAGAPNPLNEIPPQSVLLNLLAIKTEVQPHHPFPDPVLKYHISSATAARLTFPRSRQARLHIDDAVIFSACRQIRFYGVVVSMTLAL